MIKRLNLEKCRVEFEGYDSDEMVRVVVTGNQEPKSIELTQNIFDLELDEVEASILAAMKEAHSKSVAVGIFFLNKSKIRIFH